MSPANVEYTLRMNPEIPSDKVEVCPNSVEYRDMSITDDERNALRKKYDIPLDKKVFVYGGNLGKPQGIPFIIECLKAEADNKDVFFLIVGSGTEFPKLEEVWKEGTAQVGGSLIIRRRQIKKPQSSFENWDEKS